MFVPIGSEFLIEVRRSEVVRRVFAATGVVVVYRMIGFSEEDAQRILFVVNARNGGVEVEFAIRERRDAVAESYAIDPV